MQNEMTVKDALIYLARNGVKWTEVWLRTKISRKEIKSQLKFNSRVIMRSELDKIIAEASAVKA